MDRAEKRRNLAQIKNRLIRRGCEQEPIFCFCSTEAKSPLTAENGQISGLFLVTFFSFELQLPSLFFQAEFHDGDRLRIDVMDPLDGCTHARHPAFCPEKARYLRQFDKAPNWVHLR